MRITEKIRNLKLFQLGKRTIKEILNPGRQIDTDDKNWVSFGRSAERDLTKHEQNFTNELAFYQWLTDPVAGRIVEILTDFVIGSGIKITAPDESVQAVLDEMWFDEINDMPTQQVPMCSEFTIFGELCLVPYVNPISGIVQFARIDPTAIDDVIPDPQFPQIPRVVRLKYERFKDQKGNPIKELRVIHTDKDPRSKTAGQRVGDCFYFAQGKVAGKRRGHTQLLRAQEWVDIYGKRVFNEAERQELSSAYVWDVLLKGATKETAKAFLDDNETPSAASIRVHNEDVEWNVVTPDLKAQDFATSNRQFLQVILGAFGIPEHWFALGGEVNYATAKAMNLPTLKAFQRLQRTFKSVVESMADYQLEKAITARRIAAGADLTYVVELDEIASNDLGSIATATVQFAIALQTAEAQGWITKEDAAQAWAKLFNETGTEVEPVVDEAGTVPPAVTEAAKVLADAMKNARDKRKKKGICA
jgi:hypothetical protein